MASWKTISGFDYLRVKFFAELQNNIVAYQKQSDSWFSFPCIEASVDWAKCLFDGNATSLLSADQPPTFFLYLESSCNKSGYHSSLQLIDFIRFLRLSKYHPQAWSSNNQYKLWSSPVVCFSFETRERILPRSPESLILYSPSVRFKQLPALVAAQSIKSAEPPPAEDVELSTYVNSTKVVNLSAHHGLGDVIGPYSILSYFGDQLQQTVPVVKPAEAISTETLHEMFTQIEQEKLSESEYSDETKANTIINLWEQVKESVTITNPNLKANVLILDDQSEFWEPMWQTLLGGKQKFTRKNKEEVSTILESERNGSNNNRCDNLLAEIQEHALVIMDLRLDPDNDRNKELEDVSGYRLLKYIRENDKATPILMFTSSQRGRFHQQLISAEADAVCTKPTRLDTAPALLETLLEEINLLLKPEYEFLRNIYRELKDRKGDLKNLIAAETTLMLGFHAWKEARRNTKTWLGDFGGEFARSSSLSVARTLGIAHENLSLEQPRIDSVWNIYFKALEYIRNNASHSSSEHALSVHVGYLSLELFTKLLSYIDPMDITIRDERGHVLGIATDKVATDKKDNKTKIRVGLKDKLKKNVTISSIPFPSYLDFCGAVQAATLLHGLMPSRGFNLSSEGMKYVVESQRKANETVRDILSKTNIRAVDIKQAINDYVEEVHHTNDWQELRAWINLI